MYSLARNQILYRDRSMPVSYSTSSAIFAFPGFSYLTMISWNRFTPVPAGIRFPTMTFSLSPLRPSRFAPIAAVLNTFVVSWKDAADIHEEVPNEDRVIPSKIGLDV